MAHAPTRILVAWQPENPLHDGLSMASWIARTTDVRIRVATTSVRTWLPATLRKYSETYRDWHAEQSRKCQKAVAKGLRHAGIDKAYWDETYSVFLDGTSQNVLLGDAASDFAADLLIIGSGAGAQPGKFQMGTTADALLHYSPTALGLVGKKAELSAKGIKRISYPFLDDSSEGAPALLYAAHLAQRWGASLRIMALSPNADLDTRISPSMELEQRLAADWHEQAYVLLDQARARVHEALPELEITTTVSEGAGWAHAIDSVRWKKWDLLCVGSHPRGPLERVFISSTTTQFLQHVPVPAIVYPLRAE